MKEFCNIIHIFLKDQVEKIHDGLVIPKPGEVPIIVHAANFDIVPATTDSKSGLITTISLSLHIDKLYPSRAALLKIKRSAVIQINRYDDPSTIGTLQYPAQIIYTPTLNADILKVEQKQPSHTV